ncbi:MAG: hypothetical protein MJ065_08775 [Oscillospiraceae bacterium]|nr:hypothetical protein [Oscillospiraceae bacterium]
MDKQKKKRPSGTPVSGKKRRRKRKQLTPLQKMQRKAKRLLHSVTEKLPVQRIVPWAAAAAAFILIVMVIGMNTAGAKLRRKVIAETAHYRVTAAVFSCCFRQYADNYLTAAEASGNQFVYDPARPLNEQEYSNGETWYDLLFDNTLSSVKNQLRLCEAAFAAGFSLDAAQLQKCEDLANADDLARYPKGVKRADLLEAAKLSVLSSAYRDHVLDGITVSEDEIVSYYTEHQIDYHTASVLAYTFQWDPESVIAGDTAEQDAALRAAEGLAACTDQQSFNEFVFRYLTDQKQIPRSEAEQIAAELTITKFVRDYPADVRSWLEEGAERGATLQSGKTDQCTKTVYMLRDVPAPDESKTVDFRVIYLSTADSGSNENASAFAEKLKDNITAAGGTSEAFAEQALAHSEDAASYANGGLVSGYSAAQTAYGDEVAAWCFDRNRQHGDMMIAELQEGAVLVYYEQANEDSGWKNQVREDLYQAKNSAFTQECAQYEVKDLEQNYKYIRI